MFTNTVPVDAYRGAGRPEATFLLERLVDAVCHDTGLDRVEMRRQQLHPARRLPLPDAGGAAVRQRRLSTRRLNAALKVADWAGFAARRAEAARRGQAARHRHFHLSRGLRHRALEGGGLARRPRRALRSGQRARASDGQRDGVHRHPQPRPGARDHAGATGRRPARRAVRAGRYRARRHRRRSRSAWAPTAAAPRRRRLGHGEGDGQGDRQGQEDRRPSDGSLGRGHRVQGRQVHRRRHRRSRRRWPRSRWPPTSRTTTRSRNWSPGSTKPRSTTRRTSPSPAAAISARWRSIPTPAWSRW